MLRSALQTVGRGARLVLTEGEATAQQQQKRLMSSSEKWTPKQYAKEKPTDRSFAVIDHNPFIDAWAYRRDKLEKQWVWNNRNTFEFVWFVCGGFVACYYYTLWCLRQTDRRNKYPRRGYGSEPLFNPTVFVLPDEREFY